MNKTTFFDGSDEEFGLVEEEVKDKPKDNGNEDNDDQDNSNDDD